MKAFTSALPVLALALGAFAGPMAVADVESVENDSMLRDIVMTVCDRDFFRGRCEDLRSVAQRCYNLGNGWPDSITSAKTQPGTNCYLYRDNGCRGQMVELTGGGTGHQNLGWHNFNDAMSSYRCS